MAANPGPRKPGRVAVCLAACAAAAFLLCACEGAGAYPASQSDAPPVAASPSVQPSGTPFQSPPVSQSPADSAALSPPAAQTPQKNWAVCIKQTQIYAQPDTGTAAAGGIKDGDAGEILSAKNGWMQIYFNGITGYVKTEDMVTKSTPGVPAPEGNWTMILVNQSHLLPAGYAVTLAEFAGGQVDERILSVCKSLFADAEQDGVSLVLVDAYRSRELQSELFEKKVQSYLAKGYSRMEAERSAATITARPDTSEHQTGLALDIVTASHASRDRAFANTRAFKWLTVNAANYGFILRYGQDKQALTGVIYEPWHWRFVGTKAAKEMAASGQCIEEYLGETN